MVVSESERDIAYRALARRDDALARLIARHGQPHPFHWDILDDHAGSDGFSELALHIISQQLSTTAASTIYARVQTLLEGTFEPRGMIAARPEDLRAAGLSGREGTFTSGFSRPDRRWAPQSRIAGDGGRCHGRNRTSGRARDRAVVSPNVPPDFYRRPDIMPAADVGLLRSAQSAFGLPERPSPQWLETRARPWRPVRSYAAALLWAHDRDRPPNS